MKIKRFGVVAIALAAAGALTLSGCTSGDTSPSAGAGSGGIVTASSVEPQNPLVPTNTNENGGGRILEALWAGLLAYDAEGAPHNDVAESIETEDAQHYTIKIREGLEFSNGEPLTASSFVDAWNYGADTANEQLQQYFFESIEGFSYDESVPELPGLEVVDDTTFNVTLKQPESDFPLRLGYSAYYPLPESAFEDMEAFGQNPVGNGPYMLESEDAWKHNERIDLVPNPSYDGYKQSENGGLTFIFYATPEAAYADLQGGNLDIIDEVPTGALGTFQDEFEGRTVQQASAGIQTFTIPERLAHFSGDEGKLRRAAISKAIDRDEITDVIFEGARQPAKDFTAPPIDGWSDSIPGADVLEFDPEGAKELWAQADAISPWTGTFQVAYNADGGHQPWVDALANQLKNNLGIDASGAPYPTFAEVRTAVTDRTIETPFRSGWIGDYPALFNFLGPLYATNASSNDGDYSNPEVDALLKEGLAATDIEAANEKFQQAQEILFADLPAIPLWYYGVDGAWSESVDNVQYGWNTNVLYYAVTKSE